MVYELQLPSDIKIHNVFHVSLMKAFKGDNSPTLATLPPIEEGRGVHTPASVKLVSIVITKSS